MMDVLNKRVLATLSFAAIAATSVFAAGEARASEGDLDEQLEQFWASERELPVLQNRLYDREGRFSLGIHVGLLSSEPFFYYYPVGGKLSYHFSNQLGVEVGGSFMNAEGILTHDTELTEFVKARRREGFDPAVDTEDRFLWRSNAVLLWSPFYGKMAFLQRKLTHFDLNLAAGLGVVGVERPSADREVASNKVAPEGVFGAGVQFFMTPSMTVRLDGRFYVYRGAETTSATTWQKQMNVPAEFLLGFSYIF